MVRGSRSDMEASDIATSESRSELVGNGMSFCCFPFCSASVRRVSRDATICGVTYSGGNVVELSGELPLEGHGEEWGRGERRAASRDEDEEGWTTLWMRGVEERAWERYIGGHITPLCLSVFVPRT